MGEETGREKKFWGENERKRKLGVKREKRKIRKKGGSEEEEKQ